MKKHDAALVVSLTTVALVVPTIGAQQSIPPPPVAAKKAHTVEIHGYTLTDDYFWLREKSNPDVIKYLEAENAYTEEVMEPTKPLQDALYNEMYKHIKQTDLSVPSRIGEYYYYSRTEEGKQYPYMCRRKAASQSPEEILLDLNKLAEGHSFLGLGGVSVSDDGNWLAYSTDTNGYRQFTLHVKDLRTGRRLKRTSSVSAPSSGRTTTRRSSTRLKTPSPSAPTCSGVMSLAAGQRFVVRRERRALRHRQPAVRSTKRSSLCRSSRKLRPRLGIFPPTPQARR